MLDKIVERARALDPKEMDAVDCALSVFNCHCTIDLQGINAGEITRAKEELVRVAVGHYHAYKAMSEQHGMSFIEAISRHDKDLGPYILAMADIPE